MSVIQGQDKLIQQLSALTLDNFPHSLILEGKSGCGKTTFCEEIGKQLNLSVVDITEQLTQEYLELFLTSPNPALYVVKGNSISIKDQNTLLKFLEEPTKSVFVIITVTDKSYLLETIRNRCILWSFLPYTKNTLENFSDRRLLVDIAETPGQILSLSCYSDEELTSYVTLGEKIFEKIGQANFPNILSISNQIAFKAEKGKLDVSLFGLILLYVIHKKVCTSNNMFYYFAYDITKQFCYNLGTSNLNKQYLFETFLCNLRNISRSDI